MLLPHTRAPGVALRVSRVLPPEKLHRVLGGLAGLPSVEVLEQLLPGDVEAHSAQFTVERPDTGATIGVVGLHTLDLTSGHIRAEVLLTPDTDEAIVTATAALIVNYAFSMFRVRKVYHWTVDEEATAFRHLPLRVQREGALAEYVADGGRFHDVTVFTIDREDWEASAVFLDRLLEEEHTT